jgi:hypothetical protein
MIKYLKYILYISCLIGCFEINKPFEDDKITMHRIQAVDSSLYINKIIGLTHKTEAELRNKIYNKILNKNILASYKYFNKSSYILKSTVIKYKSTNKNKIIISLSSPISKKIKKLDILIPNNNLTNTSIQEQVSDKIVLFIEKSFYINEKKKLIQIININGLENYKELKYIFLIKLNNLFSKQSIEIIDTENTINKNHYSIDIDFTIDEATKEKIKLKVNWSIYDKNKNLIGEIKQENTFLRSLLISIWPEISNKIIKMSLTEINILTNVHK